MAHEIETKVLNINKAKLVKTLKKLGAKMVLKTRLRVIWYRTKGSKEGEDNWYLRIRSYSDKTSEVTWKAKSKILGKSRKHKEINFKVDEPEQIEDLFLQMNLEKYAYQEKDRTSWIYKDWRFDLDQYPNMPIFLEIEGKSEKHIHEALYLLDLENNETSAEGERILIQEKYGLNWYQMKF